MGDIKGSLFDVLDGKIKDSEEFIQWAKITDIDQFSSEVESKVYLKNDFYLCQISDDYEPIENRDLAQIKTDFSEIEKEFNKLNFDEMDYYDK